MEHVTIVGAEDDVLVLATESGERFALPIDEVLRAELRRAKAGREEKAPPLAASPREIQSHIRAGMSAADVAELLGVSREVVERFEGPVLAEREHIVGQALAVPVLIGSEVEPDAQPTFGVAIRAKLADLAAGSERWAGWKEESGWIIKLEFTANEVDHDARWSFDPRRSALSPLNADATQLSRQGALPEGLIPRLRALDKDRPSPYKDETRFDSGAFGPRLVPAPADDPRLRKTRRRDVEPRSARHPQSSSTRAGGGHAQRAVRAVDALGHRRSPGGAAPSPRTARGPPHRRRGDRIDARPLALFEALEPGYEPSMPEPPVPLAAVRRSRTAVAAAPAPGDAVLGRDRLRRPQRRLTARGAPDRQRAKAPKRSSGTRSSSGLSEPCWPIMPCAR